MTLTEYQRICAGLDSLFAYAWGGAPDGAELLEMAAALEAALQEEREANGGNLAEGCRALVADYARKGMKRSGALRESVAGYNQYFAKYTQIPELVADLEEGEGNLSANVREALISALNRLYSAFAELSGVCSLEFSRSQRGGKTMAQRIEGSPQALAIAKAVAGYLAEDYKPKEELTRRERGLIGREIGRALGYGGIKALAEYWGTPAKDLSREGGKAEFDFSPKIVGLKELLRGAGVEI